MSVLVDAVKSTSLFLNRSSDLDELASIFLSPIESERY